MSTIAVSSGNPLNAVAFAPDGTRACITRGILDSIYILDTTTGNVIATIPSDGPLGVAFSAAN
jgi:YVTN family beta-propeller protein